MNSDSVVYLKKDVNIFFPPPPLFNSLERSHSSSGMSSPGHLPLSRFSFCPRASHRSPMLSASLRSSLFSCPSSSPVQVRGHAGQLWTLPESRPGLRVWLVRGAEPVHAEAALPSPGQPVVGVVQHQGEMHQPQDHGCKSLNCKKPEYSPSYPFLGLFS